MTDEEGPFLFTDYEIYRDVQRADQFVVKLSGVGVTGQIHLSQESALKLAEALTKAVGVN